MKKITRFISSLLTATMLAGMVPAMPVFAEEEPVLLKTDRLQIEEYEDGISYVMMGTVQLQVEERGKYILTMYRDGNTDIESAVELKTADVSARYGKDYVISDDRYTTEVTETGRTLLELSADEENVKAAEQALEEMNELVESSAEETDEETSDAESEETSEKSSLAKLKEEQTGERTRETYDTDTEPLPEAIVSSMGMNIADYIETTSVTPIVFAPGETEKQIIIEILEDDESEGQEIANFILGLSDDTNENTSLVEPISASIVIEDDEPVQHSVVSFTESAYHTDSDSVTVTVKREGALYSYITAGIRTVETGSAKAGVNFSEVNETLEFRPFVDETTVEIPISATENMSFGVELFDMKGGDDGEFMSTEVYIDASEDTFTGIQLFSSSDEVEINGNSYILEKDGDTSVGKIYKEFSNTKVQVGEWYPPTTNYVTYGYHFGSGGTKKNEYNEKGKYGHLHWDNGWRWNHGGEQARFNLPFKKYQSAYLDFQTFSRYDEASCLFHISSKHEKAINEVKAKKERAIRGPVVFLDAKNKPYGHWNRNDELYINAERKDNGLVAPEMKFYGIFMMYREFNITLNQPETKEFKTPNGTVQKKPVSVSLGTGHDVRYFNQTMSIIERATEPGGTLNGRLTGFKIRVNGEKEFTYNTTEPKITFDETMIKDIDDLETKKADTNMGYRDNLSITPIYEYIPVEINLLNNDGGSKPEGQFNNKDLQSNSKNKFHMGDVLDMSATPSSEDYYYDTYTVKEYKNTGDTQPVSSGDMTPETSLELRNIKYELRPNFTSEDNYVEVRFEGDAAKYYKLNNSVPENELPDSMKGKSVLYISDHRNPSDPVTRPEAGRAYTVEIVPKDGMENAPRPVITRNLTGDAVDGYAMDFIAKSRHSENIITVSVGKNQSNEYFSLSGVAQYNSRPIRSSTGDSTIQPASLAGVTAGAALTKLYDNNGNLVYAVQRQSATAGTDGRFEVDGVYAYHEDRISIRITNNDMDQVVYCRLPKHSSSEQSSVKKFDVIQADTSQKKNVNVTKSEKCISVNAGIATMPIRTAYSPVVNNIIYEPTIHISMDTRNNSIELYDDDSILYTADVDENGTNEVVLYFLRVDKDGKKRQEYKVEKDKTKGYYSVEIPSEDFDDTDKLYVQTAVTKNKTEVRYAMIDTGLTFYTPLIESKPQYMKFSMGDDIMANLPVVGDLSADIDTGKLKWTTTYDNPNDKKTSPYSSTVMVSGILDDEVKRNINKLNKLKNGKTSEGKKSVEDQLKDFDPEKEASALDKQNLKDSIDKPNLSDKDKQEIVDKWSSDVKSKQRSKLKDEQYKKSLADLGEMDWEMQFAVLLRFEYAYDPELREHIFIGGQYLFNGSFNIEKTWYWVVYGIPVFLNVSGYASMQFDGQYAHNDNVKILQKDLATTENLVDSRIETLWPWFELGLGGKLQPGVGICGILDARGIFALDTLFRVTAGKVPEGHPNGGVMVQMTGGMAIDLLLFSYEYTFSPYKFGTGVYSTSKARLMSSDEPIGNIRNFDRGDETFTGFGDKNISLFSTLSPVSSNTLIEGGMEYIRPAMVDIGDGKLMMTFLRNDKSRENDANSASLAYTIRDASGNWSEPEWVNEDNTADSQSYMLYDNGKVYIAWSNTDEALTSDGSNIEDIKDDMQKLNISMCIYDVANDTMSAPIKVTDDDYVNGNVRLVKENDNIVLYYLKKDIEKAEDAEHLISTTANYSTWAKKEYNIETGGFNEIVDKDVDDKTEQLIDIKHPTVTDPLVYDYAVETYTYDNETANDISDDIRFKFAVYSVDVDKNIQTNDDREVWLEITDLSRKVTYYPVKLDGDKDNITSPKLTQVKNDMLITWLSDSSVFKTISARGLLGSLCNETGKVDGSDNNGVTSLGLMRSLTQEEASQKDWCDKLIEQAKAVAEDEENYEELFSTLCGLRDGTTVSNAKDFSNDGMSSANMSDYQIVVGDDNNTYLFWTGATPDVDNYGIEIYAAAYYHLNDDWIGEWQNEVNAADGEYVPMPESGWGEPVRVTNYGKTIDEMAITVDENKNAVIMANMYEQSINDNGEVEYGDHNLTEIYCIPTDSLEIVDGEIMLSDDYPVEGEPLTISVEVENTGLLPSEGDKLEIAITKDGEVIDSICIEETEDSNVIYSGNSFIYSIDWIPEEGDLDGDVEITISMDEYGAEGIYTATKKLEKGAWLEFDEPYVWTWNDIKEETELMGGDIDLSKASAEYQAINELIKRDISENDDISDYFVLVPVENVGNKPMSDITADALYMDNDFNIGDSLGTSLELSLNAKESGLIAIPVYVEEENFNKNGIIEMKVNVNSKDEKDLDRDTLHATIYETKSIGIVINDGAKNLKMKSGETSELNLRTYPFDGNMDLYCFSTDDDVATVTSDGKVTAVGNGEATIYVLDLNGLDLQGIEVNVGGSSSGGGGGSSNASYTVTFDTNGGSKVDRVKVERNKTVAKPSNPTKDGYTFAGWYTDKELTKAYDFNTKVTKAITLYAKWIENGTEPTKPGEWKNPFTDVKADDW